MTPEELNELENRLRRVGFGKGDYGALLALPPDSNIPDLVDTIISWYEEQRREVAETIRAAEIKGKSISRSEALQIAAQTLEQAEQERSRVADLEAQRDNQVEDRQ